MRTSRPFGHIIDILSSLFGIIFILLLYAKYCSHSGGPPVAPGGYPSVSAVGRKNSGIDRAVLESLLVFRFASLKGKKDGLECVVCLARFEPTEALRLLPKCGHSFAGEKARAFGDSNRSMFTFRRSFVGNRAATSRKDGMLRTTSDREEERLRWKMRTDRKVEHRIVVSDGKGLNERWSNIQSLDLLYLESRMMMRTSLCPCSAACKEEERKRK